MSDKSIKNILQSMIVASAASLMLLPEMSRSQDLFDPVVQVDEAVITEFEIQQRSRFLQVLGAPGAGRKAATEDLILDRLRITATLQAGITLDSAELDQGLADLAARAEVSTEEFTAGLEDAGVARQTFRDFVAVSLLWRNYVRARFGARVTISEDEIDRAVDSVNNRTGLQVLISEIIIPEPPEQAAQVQALAQEISQITTEAEFSEYARQFSATPSRDNGGRLEWVSLSELPVNLRPILLGLAPFEVSDPLPIPDAIALFQLRDIRETGTPAPSYGAIEYAAYYMDGGRSPETLARARAIIESIDRCDDLYGIAKGKPEEVLDRGSLPPNEIPTDVALELAKLDPGEVSTALTRANGQTLVLLMLCGRTPTLEKDQVIDRDQIAQQLRNQRLAELSDNLLEELRSDATIVFFE